ncbi:MAG: hypothetical protein STSR0007_10840 [Thermovirga sp.]
MRKETSIKSSRKGFTLVELLVVIVIIGILSGTLMLLFSGNSDKATATKIANDLRVLKSASAQFYSSNDSWPSSLEEIALFISTNLKLECADEVCYDIAIDNAGDFVGVKAELSFASSEVRSMLSNMSSAEGLYADIDLAQPYSGGSTVFAPVSSPRGSENGGTLPELLFTGDSMDKFQILSGAWSMVDGVLRPQMQGQQEQTLAFQFGESDWADYTLSVTAEASGKGQRSYGIFYRAIYNGSDISNGYIFWLDPSTKKYYVNKIINGVEYPLITPQNLPAGIDLSSSNDIAVTVSGNTQTIAIDGVTLNQFQDPSDPILSGSAGLAAKGNLLNVGFSDIAATQ